MSGHKVVAVLDAFKEGYIYGGTVYRRKQSVLNGAKRPNYTVTPQGTTAGSSSSSPQQASSSSSTVVDLVLSHRGAFKLRSKVAPPKTSIIQKSSAAASKAVAEGGAGASKRKKFSQRSAASGADGKGQHQQEDEDDSDFDPLDADAMMVAAANGGDIQRLYAQMRAKREARRRAKEEGAGGQQLSSSTSSSNRPEVVWRQEHCFVRAVTPLLGQSAEDEEDRYRRKEEEAEEERLREEEADAKLTLEHALQASSGSPLSGSRAALMPERRRQKYENADAAAEAEREKMSVTMEKRRKMTPAELANDPSMPDRELYGFTVHYFAIGKDPKKLPESTEVGKGYTQAVAIALEKAGSGSIPTIRYRTYVCGTLYEQQEWLMVYRNTLLNYWHERLESSIIMTPEIFQFQCFGMSVGGTNVAAPSSSFLASPQFPTGRGGVIHLVLSTTSLYLLPRSNKTEFEGDDTSRFVRIPAEALTSIIISKSKGTVTLVGGPFSTKAPFRVAFFSTPECSEFVVELQRIWEMSSPSAAGAESSFPYTLEA